MKDIEIFGKEFDDVVGFKMPDMQGNEVTFSEGGGGAYPPTQDASGFVVLPSETSAEGE